MNGIDLMNNLIDELNRARDYISNSFERKVTTSLTEDEILLDDIRNDLDRYYDCAEEFDEALKDIVVE